ncbi:MAG: dolichol kinase [Salinirussus sp.]
MAADGRTTSYARRLAHLSGTLVPGAYLVELLPWPTIRLVLAGGAAAAVVLEFLRLQAGLEWTVYDRLTREYERENPAGYALAVVSSALVGWTFEPRVAVPALLLLTVADPVAGILSSVGDPDTRKSWWVMAATFGLCLALTVPFLPVRVAVPVAVVVVAADALKPRVFGFVIDDNFSIPVGAGVTGWVVLQFVPPLV